MKKNLLSLAAALLLIGGNLAAQEPTVIFSDSFEEYTVGNHIASESNAAGHTWWTTWSNNPGSNEDGTISDAYASDGSKSGHFTYRNDQVLLLNDEQNGIYDIEFDILVPQGKNGYFNILHAFAGSNSTWAMQCYLHMTNDGQNSTSSPGHGTIHAGSNSTADVSCVYDGWMHFRLHVDTDHNIAQYFYTAPDSEEEMVCEWQWDLDSFGENTVGRQLGAIDFYPPQNAANSEYYVDNIKYTKTSGDTYPIISFSVDSIYKNMEVNDMDVIDFTISNEGTSIADYMGYIDFGEGANTSATQELGYYDENGQFSVVSFNVDEDEESVTIEAGAMFPASFYSGAVMGTRITKARYFIGAAESGGDTIPIMDNEPLVFRIYGPGLYNQPGELLAEKELPYNQLVISDWNEVTFDEPIAIRGFTFWATVEFVQRPRMYPLAFDGGTNEGNGAYYRTNGGSTFHNNANSDSPYGNILIGVTCQGDAIQGTWANLEKTEGSIMIDDIDIMLLSINAIGLANNTTYTADLVYVTNDPENKDVIIPIKLVVGDDGVIESIKSEVSVYPNPANGNFSIKGINLSHASIYNAVGQLVENVNLKNGVNNISLNVESGVYFISIFDNEGNTSVQRLVINK